MKWIVKCIGVSAVLLLSGTVPSHGDNPAVQTCYTADPAPFEYEGRVYMLTGHDADDAGDSYKMPDWKCYSSTDMVNWTDHGVVLSPKSLSWATTKDANASQVIERDGKFYFYISTTASGGVAVGVAVSESPIGPFTDPLDKPLISGNAMTGCNATHSWRGLDPTVFIDDDGQAYLYWGNNVLYWVKLNSDMVSYSGSISCIPQNDPMFGPDYEEGPWFYKRNNMYYLLYPSKIPESIHYATSTGPTGPWKYGGQIMPVQKGSGSSSTIHPGMLDFGGRSFFYYHNGKLPGGGNYKRSVCIEEFTYATDGSIPAIPPTDEGVKEGVGTINPFDTVQAETICWESGIKTAPCSEGGIMVESISNGDYIKVEGVDFSSGAESFQARVASGGGGGTIELLLDHQTGTPVAECTVQGTGGWDSWKTVECDISDVLAIHDIYLRFTGGSGNLFNFNWWKCLPTATGVAAPHGTGMPEVPTLRVLRGATPTLQLTLPRLATVNKVSVRLFGIDGRLAGTLFDGDAVSGRLSIPLDRAQWRSGTYVVGVRLQDRLVITRRIALE
jgi:arabinoxylan arabinofuranohydrolase